jgi:TetR/AcrR family transcriptional regulator
MRRMAKVRAKRARVRGVGRPAAEAEADVRAALIAAAKQLFLKDGFEKVTARQIAAAAGTTPAMIHYYFDNKIGLFRAMLQEAIEPFSRMLSGALDAPSGAAGDLAALIEGHIRTAAANAWIASLIVNEVLPEGGKFRAAFVREIASRLLPMLVALIEQGRRDGKFREDIDARLTALSIVSLNIFPLISRPITGPILGFKFEGADLDRLIAHTTKLLLQGIAMNREGQKS